VCYVAVGVVSNSSLPKKSPSTNGHKSLDINDKTAVNGHVQQPTNKTVGDSEPTAVNAGTLISGVTNQLGALGQFKMGAAISH